MKILVVASTFPSSDTDPTPAFVRDLAVALKLSYPQVQLSILAPHYRDTTKDFTRHDHFDEYRFGYFFPRRLQGLAGRGIVPSIESNRAAILMVPFLFIFELLAMLALVRKLRPDVIHAHWFTPQGVNAAIVSSLTGVPYVLTSHANDVRIWARIPVIGRHIVRRLLPRATRITAVSDITRDRMRGFFPATEWAELERRIAVIPMGVDMQQVTGGGPPQHDLKQRYGYGGYRVIYFIGRLASKKGVTFLIEAMAQIAMDNVKLVIAGDGPLKDSLQAKARQLGIANNVDFIGYVSGQRKLDYLRLSDVVAVPSIETASGDAEGLPVVIIEALAAGKPCVASDASGADAFIIDGHNGFIVPQKDSEALARTINGVLALDGVSLQEITRRATDAVRSCDWAIIAKRHFEFLFRSIL